MIIDINADMEMVLPLLAQMASPRESLGDYKLYRAGVGHQAGLGMPRGGRPPSGYLSSCCKQDAYRVKASTADISRLATALEPYTRHGVYASYFEGEANIQFDKDFVVLELEELKSEELQSVVMQLIMYRITQFTGTVRGASWSSHNEAEL